jgi:hypothetical protein
MRTMLNYITLSEIMCLSRKKIEKLLNHHYLKKTGRDHP